MTPSAISKATRIPSIGERWFKQKRLDLTHYHPFLKPSVQAECEAIFPFSHLLDRYALLMNIIMKYFTCDGRFSRVYSYHIRILMHFTTTKLLHMRYYLCKIIEKISSIMKKRPPAQQMSSLFHNSLIKVIVSYQLEQKGIPWEVFITHDDFTTSPSIPLQSFPSSSQNPPHTPPSPSIDLGSSSSHE